MSSGNAAFIKPIVVRVVCLENGPFYLLVIVELCCNSPIKQLYPLPVEISTKQSKGSVVAPEVQDLKAHSK